MVATNDTVELALVGTKAGQTILVTHHFRITQNPVSSAGLQDLIDTWQAACQSAWLALNTTTYTFQSIRARHVCGSVPLEATAEETVNSAGTFIGSGDLLPPWFALIARERTASAGRSRRGRFFLPLSQEGDVLGDGLASGAETKFQAYLTALGGAFLAGGSAESKYRLVVHSRKLASVPGTQCQNSSTLVTQLVLRPVLTTQRSRRQRPA